MSDRHYSFLDKICLSFDQALRTLSGQVQTTGALYPAAKIDETVLTNEARQHAASLMRVNHAGEVCAQALYFGQALVARKKTTALDLTQAAYEEGDHLAWCEKRLLELHSHTSYLNPIWYTGSFCIGVLAGWISDKWSLGFVVETEQQVIQHLKKHMASLPTEDKKSQAILQQMIQDETKHHDQAYAKGATALPSPIKYLMTGTSTIMVKTAYWI